jgi:orotate phosphoribosyltransferase
MDLELEDLARDIDDRCRLNGQFTLRSGQTAHMYFDKYLFESDPVLLERVVQRMVDLVPANVDMLGGLELGGVPLTTLLSHMTGLPTLFVRKEAKTYGTCRLAEGGDPAGRTILLVEDVISTGGAIRNAAQALRDLGATVTTVVCAIDRPKSEVHPLAADGLEVRAVLKQSQLDSLSALP